MGLGVVVSKRKKMITCFPIWRHWGRNRTPHQRGEGIMKDTYDQSVCYCGTRRGKGCWSLRSPSASQTQTFFKSPIHPWTSNCNDTYPVQWPQSFEIQWYAVDVLALLMLFVETKCQRIKCRMARPENWPKVLKKQYPSWLSSDLLAKKSDPSRQLWWVASFHSKLLSNFWVNPTKPAAILVNPMGEGRKNTHASCFESSTRATECPLSICRCYVDFYYYTLLPIRLSTTDGIQNFNSDPRWPSSPYLPCPMCTRDGLQMPMPCYVPTRMLLVACTSHFHFWVYHCHPIIPLGLELWNAPPPIIST